MLDTCIECTPHCSCQSLLSAARCTPDEQSQQSGMLLDVAGPGLVPETLPLAGMPPEAITPLHA